MTSNANPPKSQTRSKRGRSTRPSPNARTWLHGPHQPHQRPIDQTCDDVRLPMHLMSTKQQAILDRLREQGLTDQQAALMLEPVRSPSEMRHLYTRALDHLSFNSKPVINMLTDLAAEHSQYADVVVSLIAETLTAVKPSSKLSYLYVADSILKNVGGDYIDLLAADLSRIFANVYSVSGQEARGKLVRLLKTWPPFMQEYPEVLQAIVKNLNLTVDLSRPIMPVGGVPKHRKPSRRARELYGAQDVKPSYSSSSSSSSQGQQVHQKMEQQQQTPQLDLQKLAQLNQLLQSGALGQQLPQPQQQQQPQQYQQQQHHQQQQQQYQQQQAALNNQRASAVYNEAQRNLQQWKAMLNNPHALAQLGNPAQLAGAVSSLRARLAEVATLPHLTQEGVGALRGQIQLADQLLSSLSFFSKQHSQQQGAQQQQHNTNMSLHGNARPQQGSDPMDLSFDNIDNENSVEEYVYSVYDRYEERCSTCSQRFHTKTDLQAHMDWHFVRNKAKREATQNSLSRSWFSRKEEWLSDRASAQVAFATFHPFQDSLAGDEQPEELPPSSVPADKTQTTCPVCGEKFEEFYDDDEEEWMYKDALRPQPNGKIYHVACWASHTNSAANKDDSTRSNASLLQSLKQKLQQNAMQLDEQQAAATADDASRKRKLDQDTDTHGDHTNGAGQQGGVDVKKQRVG